VPTKLAASLHHRGVGPDVSWVGLCLPRTPALLIALLAILKASAAYVPLDPNYPAERLSFMLADAQVASRAHPVLLSALFASPTTPREPVLSVAWMSWTCPWVTSNLRCLGRALAEHLAYVIYTSGSTGRPKGGRYCP